MASADPLAVFRKFPTGLVVFLGILVVAGAALALSHVGRTAAAMCNGNPMSPDDICVVRSRRARTTSEWTYQERLDFNVYENLSFVWGGAVIALFAAIMIVVAIIRWRRDIAVADRLAGGPEPLAAYAKATGFLAGFLTLGACVVGLIGAMAFVRSFGGKGTPVVGIVIAVIAVIVAVGMLWLGRARGCILVWAYPPAVRVVSRSKVRDIAWQDMQYAVTLGDNRAMMLSWIGHKDRLSIEDKDFFTTMRDQINGAVREVVPARTAAGELVDFRSVKITGPTVTIGRKTVPGADLGGVAVTRDKNGSYFEFRDKQGKAVGSAATQDVGNIDVLFELLSRQFGVSLQRS